jgi:hypothetical protein
MDQHSYYLDNELRVLQTPDGSKHVGISKKAIFPHDALDSLEKIEDEFVTRLKKFREAISEEIDTQESEIQKGLDHAMFLVTDKWKGMEWNANRMFDEMRLHYIKLIDNLKKEKRGLRISRLKELKQTDNDIRDAERDRMPFKGW